MTAYTFKAQAKSNAKRFLVKTSKIDEVSLDKYLVQNDGAWGCWVNEQGTPVQEATAKPKVLVMDDAAWDITTKDNGQILDANSGAELVPPFDAAEGADAAQPDDAEDAAPSAFGQFAMAQLTAPSNSGQQEPARASREGATPTSGLKIQKDRPEQNGVRRQSAGSVGDKLWTLYDAAGKDVTLEQAKAMAQAAGLSGTSAAIALYNWRRFHGIQSRAAK